MKNLRHIFSCGLFILALVNLHSFRPSVVLAEGCGGPFPPKPQNVWAKAGPGQGQVTLSWDEAPYANRYAVAYGTSPGNYLYGANNIGGASSRSYSVSGLNGGTKYYFRLAAANGCASSPFSNEVSAFSSGVSTGGVVFQGGINQQSSYTKSANSNLSAWSGPSVGQVTIKWWPVGDTDNHHLVYGTTKGHDEYGALNIGKSGQLTVKSLSPGKTYYFSVVSVKGDRAQNTSQAVWAKAYVPVVQTVQTTPVNLMQPTSASTQEPEDFEESEVLEDEKEVEDAEEDEQGDEDADTDNEDEDNNVQGMQNEVNQRNVESPIGGPEDFQPPFEQPPEELFFESENNGPDAPPVF